MQRVIISNTKYVNVEAFCIASLLANVKVYMGTHFIVVCFTNQYLYTYRFYNISIYEPTELKSNIWN